MSEKHASSSIKRDRITQYFGLIILALILSSGMVFLKLRDIQPEVETEPENLVDFKNVQLDIETDKEAYILGEAVEASFMFTNEAEHSVFINPIYYCTISGGSVNNPEKMSVEVHSTYEQGSRLEIPPEGTTFSRMTFTPLYPGEFEISWLGMSKAVNVTGYKEVRLNSTGISLEIQTSQTEFKIGDQIEVSLVIRNSNPYPVKVPVYQNVTESAVPIEKPRKTIFISWAMPYFIVEANSTRTTLTDRVTLRLPHYAKYWYVDGQQVFIEFEVAP